MIRSPHVCEDPTHHLDNTRSLWRQVTLVQPWIFFAWSLNSQLYSLMDTQKWNISSNKLFQWHFCAHKTLPARTINRVQVSKQLTRKLFKSTMTSSRSETLYSTLESVPWEQQMLKHWKPLKAFDFCEKLYSVKTTL